MNGYELVEYIRTSRKRTPVKAFIRGELQRVSFGESCRTFGFGETAIVFGDWEDIQPVLAHYAECIHDYVVESRARNSAIPLLDLTNLQACVEPGAVIRQHVHIGFGALIKSGASINIGAAVGEGSRIEEHAVIGGQAQIGRNCVIGAGVIIKGVISSPTAMPVVIEDEAVIGPRAVIMEGVRIGRGVKVAAGYIVTADRPAI